VVVRRSACRSDENRWRTSSGRTLPPGSLPQVVDHGQLLVAFPPTHLLDPDDVQRAPAPMRQPPEQGALDDGLDGLSS
jgi:hypothetical protein